MKRTIFVAILFLLASGWAKTQTPVPLGPGVIPPHVLYRPSPEFRLIFRTGFMAEGTVVIQAIVNAKGYVSDAHAVSGPAMLQEVAMESVSKYTFTPAKLKGKPVAAKILIKMDFRFSSAPNEIKGWGKFQKALKKCQEQIKESGVPTDQVKTCGNATRLADLLPDNTQTFDRTTAYVQYATALIRDGKAPDAIQVGEKAITIAEERPEILLTLSAAYQVTGEALAIADNLNAADHYLTQAEECKSKELSLPISPPLRQHDSQIMKGLLQFHAKVLSGMGKQKEAKSKLKQAAKL